MLKMSRWLALACISTWAYASHFDVFGASERVALDLTKKYGQTIEIIERQRMLAASRHQPCERQNTKILALKTKLKQDYHFNDVCIDSVLYPKRAEIFTTVSVCANAVPLYPIQAYPRILKPDIIDRMHFFIVKAVDFLVQHPEFSHRLRCKDAHCISPEHPYFQQDLLFFRQNVEQQWALIQHSMLYDPIFERRRAAIFLLPYAKHPELKSALLTKLLADKSAYIRHDALRVYGELLAKYPAMPVHLIKIIPSLSACHVDERNKTLILLNKLADQPRYHAGLVRLAARQLLSLLKLQQPNNHQFAYQILRKLSAKSYGARDYGAWQAWVNQVKTI